MTYERECICAPTQRDIQEKNSIYLTGRRKRRKNVCNEIRLAIIVLSERADVCKKEMEGKKCSSVLCKRKRLGIRDAMLQESATNEGKVKRGCNQEIIRKKTQGKNK